MTLKETESKPIMATFFSAPHRMMFLAGALQLIVTQLWWGMELVERYTGVHILPATTIAPVFAHQFLMLYGAFGFFMFGFLMTTFPRWFQQEPFRLTQYTPCFGLLALGIVGFYLGLFWNKVYLFYGIAIFTIGWGLSIFILARLLFAHRSSAKHYEWILNAVLIGGFSGILAYGYWLGAHNSQYLIYSMNAGLWLYLIPLLFTIAHRMIPFFSNIVIEGYRVYQPSWSLPLLGVCVVGHFACEMFTLQRWLIVFDLPLLLLAVHLTRQWRLRQSLRNRLLAMLHISFAWLAIAAALFVVQSIGQLLTATHYLDRAPIHAVGIGLVTSMVIAIASRVSLGHSGRPLIADNVTWYCFLSLQMVAVLRVFSELSLVNSETSDLLNIISAGIWILALTTWCIRYIPILLSPRVDGKPG